jgi:hypothetical protein
VYAPPWLCLKPKATREEMDNARKAQASLSIKIEWRVNHAPTTMKKWSWLLVIFVDRPEKNQTFHFPIPHKTQQVEFFLFVFSFCAYLRQHVRS